jgi:UDP-GlcNAc3NAcA epimerase
MLKLITIIGARPQFIKAAALSRAIKNHYSNQLEEVIVHTGQHYDTNMSKVFFDELLIPKPNYQLTISSKSADQYFEEMKGTIGEIISQEKPNAMIVFGDTQSTLAGAEAAHTNNLPLVHIEAGLRSFNDEMPEEYNRLRTDQISQLLFTPTEIGLNNLLKEGIHTQNSASDKKSLAVYHCGDIMYDNSIHFASLSQEKSTIIEELNLPNKYLLATVHRNFNTDNPTHLSQIFKAFLALCAKEHTVVLPLHPRTKKMLLSLPTDFKNEIEKCKNLKIIEPVSFLDIIALESNADLILTDSGGVQKEAFFFKKPCVILREETEWMELVENGNAMLSGASTDKILVSVEKLLNKKDFTYPSYYGDGNAAQFMCGKILKHIPC